MAESSLFRRDAQKAYEKKDYRGALAFLKAILTSGPSQCDLLAALDLRVSIYLKLDDKVSARKDATHMIRTNRADGRGYLRLGQLERLAADHVAAMKWYEHGLKKVPENDRLHAFIVAQHTKTMAVLKAQTVVSKPVDPFMKLPAEVSEMIARFLTYREAVLCLRVSKTWRHMLHTYSTLRNTLDFSQVGKDKLVTFAGIKAALRRSQKAERPILVIAKNLTLPAARHLKETMERWIHYTKMQHFEVDYPLNWDHQASSVDFQFLQWHQFQLRTVFFGSEHDVSLDSVYRILRSCEALQEAVFLSVKPGLRNTEVDSWTQSTAVSRPNLTSLTIQGFCQIFVGDQYHPFSVPVKFFERFVELQHLTLKGVWLNPLPNLEPFGFDFSSLGRLQSFDISKSRFWQFPTLPASLELLDCTECWVDVPWPLHPKENSLQHLQIARLARCRAGPRLLQSITNSASDKLRYLDVDLNAGALSDLSWSELLSTLRAGSLKELTFLRVWYEQLSDEDIDEVVKHCRKLEVVDLSSPKITGVSIAGLLTAPENRVKRLALKDCTKVSPDTYEWARQRGVVVERTTTEVYGRSGRRVRGVD